MKTNIETEYNFNNCKKPLSILVDNTDLFLTFYIDYYYYDYKAAKPNTKYVDLINVGRWNIKYKNK